MTDTQPCKHCSEPVAGVTNYGDRDYPLCPSCWHAAQAEREMARYADEEAA